jgi:hypothetical protein
MWLRSRMAHGNEPKTEQMGFVLRFWLEHGDRRRFWRGSAEETGVDDPSRVHIQDTARLVRFIRECLFRRTMVRLPKSHQSDNRP